MACINKTSSGYGIEMQEEGVLATCKGLCQGLRSQWPRAQRRGSEVAHLLGLRVRIPVSDSCECCVLSGRVIWVGLIIRPEEFYRVWFV
jgi:hypothetical protein